MVDILELFPEGNNVVRSVKKVTNNLFFFNNKLFNKHEILLTNILDCTYIKNNVALITHDKYTKNNNLKRYYSLYNIDDKEFILEDYDAANINTNSIKLLKDGKWGIYFLDTNVLYKGDRLEIIDFDNSIVHDITNRKIIDELGREIFDTNSVILHLLKHGEEDLENIIVVTFRIHKSNLIKLIYIDDITKEKLYYVIITKSGEVVYKDTFDINFYNTENSVKISKT